MEHLRLVTGIRPKQDLFLAFVHLVPQRPFSLPAPLRLDPAYLRPPLLPLHRDERKNDDKPISDVGGDGAHRANIVPPNDTLRELPVSVPIRRTWFRVGILQLPDVARDPETPRTVARLCSGGAHAVDKVLSFETVCRSACKARANQEQKQC